MPRTISTRVLIDAPLTLVWQTLTDVEQMPSWTPSITDVTATGPGPVALGCTYLVRQPKMPQLTWEVTELQPERSFAWTTHTGGVTIVGGHVLEPRSDGRAVEAVFSITQTGRGAGLVALLTGRRTRRYVQQEIEGLKQVCERTARST